jgi:hypothetical protein
VVEPGKAVTSRGFVDKWLTLGAAFKDGALANNDRHVFWEILNHANNKTHLAYPSARTLAQRTGIDLRNLSKHVKKIVGEGYLTKVKTGDWHGNSNCYIPTFKGADALRKRASEPGDDQQDSEAVVTGDDTPPVVTGDDSTPVVSVDDTLLSSTTQPVVAGDAKVSSVATTKPPNEPAYKAGELVVGDGKSGPRRAGTSGAALAAAPRPKSGEAFARFISACPRKSNVAAAEPLFEAVLASGVSAELLVSQAAAYAARCEREGTLPNHIQEPANWLRKRRWLDDFSGQPLKPRSAPAPKGKAGVERSGSEPAVEMTRQLEAKPTDKSRKDMDSAKVYHSEESQQARAFTKLRFLELKNQMDKVDRNRPLRDQLLSLVEYAEESCAPELEDATGSTKVDKFCLDQIDEVVSEVSRGEWGDVDSCDLNDNRVTVSSWFWPDDPSNFGAYLMKWASARAETPGKAAA